MNTLYLSSDESVIFSNNRKCNLLKYVKYYVGFLDNRNRNGMLIQLDDPIQLFRNNQYFIVDKLVLFGKYLDDINIMHIKKFPFYVYITYITDLSIEKNWMKINRINMNKLEILGTGFLIKEINNE